MVSHKNVVLILILRYLVRSGEGDECYEAMNEQRADPSGRSADDLDLLSACCASAMCASCLSCLLLNAS